MCCESSSTVVATASTCSTLYRAKRKPWLPPGRSCVLSIGRWLLNLCNLGSISNIAITFREKQHLYVCILSCIVKSDNLGGWQGKWRQQCWRHGPQLRPISGKPYIQLIQNYNSNHVVYLRSLFHICSNYLLAGYYYLNEGDKENGPNSITQIFHKASNGPLMEPLVSTYNHWMSFADKRVENWPLMSQVTTKIYAHISPIKYEWQTQSAKVFGPARTEGIIQ